eukprot:CAMPEP_0183712744 /NCGR_PEP_ID=MMETSP0737-20130205/7809_1 /TAXON_ID=385413 /ORGANISM="Thalassiosira miniscula, Strain CCMP1093" /LENGTH=445 /DNA_ID=CAMNT_0025941423 /DNA_START=563 /DNA_END=1900 /DNA_ORIENTATION=+
MASLAGWGGSLADSQERASPSWGSGRLKVLALALALGSVAFLGHGMPEFAGDIFPMNDTVVLMWHISMRCIYAVSLGIVAPCLDGITLAHLDCIEGSSTTEFGKERMYGAFFWGLGSLAAGIGIDHYGYDFLYAMLVVSLLASYVAMGVYLWGLGRDTTGAFTSLDDVNGNNSIHIRFEYQHEEPKSNSESEGVIPNVELFQMLFKTAYGQAIIFLVFTISMGVSVVDNLAFIFFDVLGASNTMDGWTVVFTVIFEIPVFYVAPIILERYGPGRLLVAAGIAYIIRVVGYTLVPEGDMYIILMLETLHGLTYAGSKSGSVEFVSRLMPEGHEASGQGILVFITYFGVVAGLIMAGWMQETLGARFMFRVMAAIVSVGVIVYALAELFCDKTEQEAPTETKSESCHLTKSDSCASSASAFADNETERYIRKMKYDSLNKYVQNKDW